MPGKSREAKAFIEVLRNYGVSKNMAKATAQTLENAFTSHFVFEPNGYKEALAMLISEIESHSRQNIAKFTQILAEQTLWQSGKDIANIITEANKKIEAKPSIRKEAAPVEKSSASKKEKLPEKKKKEAVKKRPVKESKSGSKASEKKPGTAASSKKKKEEVKPAKTEQKGNAKSSKSSSSGKKTTAKKEVKAKSAKSTKSAGSKTSAKKTSKRFA